MFLISGVAPLCFRLMSLFFMISTFQTAAVTCVITEINTPVRPALSTGHLECYESILVIDN